MNYSSEKAAVLLMPYSQRKQQRILSLLTVSRAANIREKLIKANDLSLCLDDFSQKKLPLAVFNCETKTDVELLRLHASDTKNELCTAHVKQMLLGFLNGEAK